MMFVTKSYIFTIKTWNNKISRCAIIRYILPTRSGTAATRPIVNIVGNVSSFAGGADGFPFSFCVGGDTSDWLSAFPLTVAHIMEPKSALELQNNFLPTSPLPQSEENRWSSRPLRKAMLRCAGGANAVVLRPQPAERFSRTVAVDPAVAVAMVAEEEGGRKL